MSTNESVGRALVRALIACAAYGVSGKISLCLDVLPVYAAPVWPAAGMALAFVVVWSPRVVPAIVVGSFVVHLGALLDVRGTWALGGSIATALGIAAGAGLQAWLGARLFRRVAPSLVLLEDARELVVFSVVGGTLSCAVGALLGVASLTVSGVIPWSDAAFTGLAWWVGETIGVLIFGPLTILALAAPSTVSWARRAAVGLPLVIGFAAVVVLFVQARRWERDRAHVEFENRARPLAQAIVAALVAPEALATSAVSLFETSEEVTRAEFHVFDRRVRLGRQAVLAVTWNPLVRHAERAAFEGSADAPSFGVKEPSTSGPALASASSFYLPVRYVEPDTPFNRTLYGMDIASEPMQREAVERGARTGEPSVTPQMILGQGRRGVVLVAPVLAASQVAVVAVEDWQPRAIEALRGFVAVMLDAEALLATAARDLDYAGLAIVLTDDDAPPERRVLGRLGTREAAQHAPSWRSRTRVVVGGRVWSLEIGPTEARRDWQAWFVLVGGGITVSVLGALMLIASGQTAQSLRLLEAERSHTIRLAQAEERFRLALEAAPTGMMMLDAGGRIVLANAQAVRLTGADRDALIGEALADLVPPRLRGRYRDWLAADEGRARRSSRTGSLEVALVHRSGHEVPVELGSNLASMPDGMFALLSVSDVSERRDGERERDRLMAELTTLNAELEARVERRTGELSSLVKEREVLLQEVHHRVGNNLQVVSSIIRLQLRRLEAGPSRDALLECKQRVQAIALVHESLYKSNNYAEVKLSDFAKDLTDNVLRTMARPERRVNLALDVDDVMLTAERAIPCGLLLNELVCNALEHAFRDHVAGTIWVELKRAGDQRLRLLVRDDGAGLPSDLELETARSTGLRLIRALSAQLDARVRIASEGGASFEFVFSTRRTGSGEASMSPAISVTPIEG